MTPAPKIPDVATALLASARAILDDIDSTLGGAEAPALRALRGRVRQRVADMAAASMDWWETCEEILAPYPDAGES